MGKIRILADFSDSGFVSKKKYPGPGTKEQPTLYCVALDYSGMP
jgi:hypothetical protein